MLNDFEALALSLPRLGPGQMRPHAAPPRAMGTLAVIGPGTGLGVGAVVADGAWLGGRWRRRRPRDAGPGDDFESAPAAAGDGASSRMCPRAAAVGIGLPVLQAPSPR